jgi:hypothetical protein
MKYVTQQEEQQMGIYRAQGFTYEDIGNLTGFHRETVSYHLNPQVKRAKNIRNTRYAKTAKGKATRARFVSWYSQTDHAKKLSREAQARHRAKHRVERNAKQRADWAIHKDERNARRRAKRANKKMERLN